MVILRLIICSKFSLLVPFVKPQKNILYNLNMYQILYNTKILLLILSDNTRRKNSQICHLCLTIHPLNMAKKLFFNSPIYQTVQSYLLLPITSAEYDVGTYMLKIVKVA